MFPLGEASRVLGRGRLRPRRSNEVAATGRERRDESARLREELLSVTVTLDVDRERVMVEVYEFIRAHVPS